MNFKLTTIILPTDYMVYSTHTMCQWHFKYQYNNYKESNTAQLYKFPAQCMDMGICII